MRFTSRETRASLAFIGALAVIFFTVLATRQCGTAPVAPPASSDTSATPPSSAAIPNPNTPAAAPANEAHSDGKRKKRGKKPIQPKQAAPDAPSPLDRPVDQM